MAVYRTPAGDFDVFLPVLCEALKVATSNGYRILMCDSKNEQQASWQLVRNYTGNVRKSISILNEIPQDQKSCENVLHELNAYFVSVDDFRPDDDAAYGDNVANYKYESLSNSLVLENTDLQE
ncbi:hypothetical protein HHI36_011321, partial [Cryptolaemus montrouzieri]